MGFRNWNLFGIVEGFGNSNGIRIFLLSYEDVNGICIDNSMNDDQSIYILSRYAEFLYEEKLNPLNSHYVERTKDSFVKDLHTIHDVLY